MSNMNIPSPNLNGPDRDHQEGVSTIERTVTLANAHIFGLPDEVSECLNLNVYFQLVSSEIVQGTSNAGRSNRAELECISMHSEQNRSQDSKYRVSFDWDRKWGIPGAVLVFNNYKREFFLKDLSITFPGRNNIRFLCNSWIYPTGSTSSEHITERIFFANNSYLPHETPAGLVDLRTAELVGLRGDGTGERKTPDRVYDYDVYNDLGDVADSDKEFERKVLGGSKEFPYPRRCRTGLPRSTGSGTFYIPRDEQLNPHENLGYFATHFQQSFNKAFIASTAILDFLRLEDVKSLYSSERVLDGADKTIRGLILSILPTWIVNAFAPWTKILYDFIKMLPVPLQSLIFPLPNIISEDDAAWKKDEEFGRQTLSGLNPMVIRCLDSFPPLSNLNPGSDGSPEGSITPEQILKHLDGMSVEEAIKSKRLFILDYYDAYIPYVDRVNKLPRSKMYATLTIFFLSEGALKPVAIELCLPQTSVEPASKRVFTPPDHCSGEEHEWLWELAKAHVRANDSGYHQLVNHWLRTHAVVEPFIISTQRNLSKLHPLHKLLLPHFRNTMQINSLARQQLINAGGIIEQCFTTGKYSMEISAKVYREWRFDEQGLPADLLKRGMAVSDPTDKANGLRLVIKDYPYAVDGLEIWAALKSWVSEYISLYYPDDQTVQSDAEVQAWWKEIVEVGHGDQKHGWYNMNSVEDLKGAITTLIWIASAHHAAVNFGQYGYAGFMPNHPSITRRLIPEKGSTQYSDFLQDKEKYFVQTLSDPKTAATTMAVLELLSKHSSDEVYLGQGSASEWVDDPRVESAFKRFRSDLIDIEKNIDDRNRDTNLINRCGLAKIPYTLLYPATSDSPGKTSGLTFKGIPNSVSI